MASTYDQRKTVSAPAWNDRVRFIELEIDTTDQAIAQNETISLYDLPAGVVIDYAQLYVSTEQATITDVDLGISTDGSTDASLLDGVSLAASSAYVGEQPASESPTYVNADNILVFTNKDANTIEDAIIRIILKYTDMRTKMAAQ